MDFLFYILKFPNDFKYIQGMKYLLLFENYVNKKRSEVGFIFHSYDDEKKWNCPYLKMMKPDDVVITGLYLIDGGGGDILEMKLKLRNIKYKKVEYNDGFIINKKDLELLSKLENHRVNKFSDITKEDLKRIIVDLFANFQGSWKSEETLDNCYKKLSLNYPVGFKNIPDVIRLFRYLEVDEESKIRTEHLGIHFVSNKKDINDDFLDSIWVGDKDGYIVEIETTKNQIDVKETIENNLYYPDEHEITLKENAKYKIIKVWKYQGKKSIGLTNYDYLNP